MSARRKISQLAAHAFLNKQSFSSANTSTDGTTLYLHGNAIARHTAKGIQITNAGRATNTTKERLSALPNVSIQQKKGVWCLNGEEWNGTPKYI